MKWCQAVDFKKPENIYRMKKAIEKERLDPTFIYPVMGEKWSFFRYLFGRKNPATGKVIVASAFADAKMMQEAVRIAKEGQKKWEKVSVEERIARVKKARSLLAEDEETGYRPTQRFFEAAASVVKNNGFSYYESVEEIREEVDHYSLSLEWAEKNLFIPEKALYQMVGEKNIYIRRPLGVVGVISPFNFPRAIPAADIIPALLCGNSVLFKPSEKAVLPGYRLCEALWGAGIPKDVLLFVPGEGSVAARFIAECPDVYFFTFTGSKQVGFDLLSRWAQSVVLHQTMRRAPYLELGGKNCIYIDRNVDIRRVVTFLIQSQFGRGGEKCSANSIVLAHKDIYAEFLRMYKEALETFFGSHDPKTGKLLIVGDPVESSNIFFGPMIDKAHKEKVEGFIERGKKNLKVLFEMSLDGEECAEHGHFVGPVVFFDVPEDHEVATTEIFGPVIGVLPVRDEDHAIAFANSRGYDLTRGDFSNLPSVRKKFIQEGKQGAGYSGRGITGNIPGQGFGGHTKSTDSGPGRGFPDYPERFCMRSFYCEDSRFYGKIIDAEDLEISRKVI